MQHPFRKVRLSLVLSAILGLATSASATIVLNDASFTGSSYTFASTGAQLSNGPAYVNGGTSVSQNMDWLSEGNGQNFTSPWYYDGVGPDKVRFFILAFDFSQVSTQVDSFTVDFDRVTLFPDVQNTLVTIEWSTDLSSWNLLRTVASQTGTAVDSVYTSSQAINMGDPDALYYRVLFGAINTALPADFAGHETQWGRSGLADTAFSITFHSVPEPSTWALLTVFGLVLVGIRKCRNHRAA